MHLGTLGVVQETEYGCEDPLLVDLPDPHADQQVDLRQAGPLTLDELVISRRAPETAGQHLLDQSYQVMPDNDITSLVSFSQLRIVCRCVV